MIDLQMTEAAATATEETATTPDPPIVASTKGSESSVAPSGGDGSEPLGDDCGQVMIFFYFFIFFTIFLFSET